MASPSSGGIWVRQMISAAALTKPISTGTDSRLSSQPRRSTPSASWNRPDSSASSSARPTRSSPGLPASGRMLAPTSRLVSATGPVDSWPQEPNRAATTAGTSAA